MGRAYSPEFFFCILGSLYPCIYPSVYSSIYPGEYMPILYPIIYCIFPNLLSNVYSIGIFQCIFLYPFPFPFSYSNVYIFSILCCDIFVSIRYPLCIFSVFFVVIFLLFFCYLLVTFLCSIVTMSLPCQTLNPWGSIWYDKCRPLSAPC